MQKKVSLFFGVAFLVLVGGVLAVKVFSSDRLSTQETSLPSSLTNSPFKISGVIKSITLLGPDSASLVLTGDGGSVKHISISTDAPVVSEGKTLKISELKPGDVMDMDCEFDPKTGETIVQKAAVIAGPTSGQALQDKSASKDPTFD